MNPSFVPLRFSTGLLYDHSKSAYPTRFHALCDEDTFYLMPGSTYFIYQHQGHSWLNNTYPLQKGHYAAMPGFRAADAFGDAALNIILGTPGSRALIIERIHNEEAGEQTAPFALGGPIEQKGRLKYIDGCTDSLLIAPWKKGEACLNHLHFPAGIDQTSHTHPSIRIGLVARGYGECITPWGNIPLEEDMLFCILPSTKDQHGQIDMLKDDKGTYWDIGTHAFRTTDSSMDVIAFHPDSDFGPEDENHPMINRTMVGGISASTLAEIRTK